MEVNMVTAIKLALQQEMQLDEKVVVLGEDVGVDGGVFRATDGLIQEFGEKRVMDTPLAESGIVGVSIGLALFGLKPVAEIQFSGFMYQAFHQIASHMSKIRNRTRSSFSVPMVIRSPYGAGIRALEEHSESTESLYSHIPGIKVVIPSSPRDAKGLLASAINDSDPVIFLEPMKLYRAFKEEVSQDQFFEEIGKAKIVFEGSDLTVVSWGTMLQRCKSVVEELAREGHSIELIDLRTIKPLDTKTLQESVEKTGRIVVVEEAHKSFGPGAEIIARISENCFYNLEAPVKRLSGFDVPVPFFKREDYYMPDKKRIKNELLETLLTK